MKYSKNVGQAIVAAVQAAVENLNGHLTKYPEQSIELDGYYAVKVEIDSKGLAKCKVATTTSFSGQADTGAKDADQ